MFPSCDVIYSIYDNKWKGEKREINSTGQEKKTGRLHEEEETWWVRINREGGWNPSPLVLLTHSCDFMHINATVWITSNKPPRVTHKALHVQCVTVGTGGVFIFIFIRTFKIDEHTSSKKLSPASVRTTSSVQTWELHMHTRLCFPSLPFPSSSPRTYHAISIRTCS